jgi:hypothetical protein
MKQVGRGGRHVARAVSRNGGFAQAATHQPPQPKRRLVAALLPMVAPFPLAERKKCINIRALDIQNKTRPKNYARQP